MPTTPIFNLPYPDPTDAPDGPTQIQSLAEAVEASLGEMYGGMSFGGSVSVGGNLNADGSLTVSGNSTLNNVDAGEVSATLVESSGDVSAGGDVYARGTAVARLVRGKVHTGALVDTSTTSTTTYQNIYYANVQSVPVVAGHAYKAEFQIAVSSSVSNDRIRYTLWNGTVGENQCGSIAPIVRVETANTFRVQTFSFIWKAPNTEVIDNLNLAMIRFSGSGVVETRIESTSFYALVYDLGPASAISAL